MQAFHRKAGDLYRAVQGAVAHTAELNNRVAHLKAGIASTPGATEADAQTVRELETTLADIGVALNGDDTVSSRSEPVEWSVSQRSSVVYGRLLDTRSPVPGFYEDSYGVAASEFETILTSMRAISRDLEILESRIESLGGPWTPGRTPEWSGR